MASDNRGASLTRRNVVQGAAAGVLAAGAATVISKEAVAQETYDAIVIGTGFGGAVATIALSNRKKKTFVIERGTFWITPETLGLPPGKPPAFRNAMADWARDPKRDMRVQYWPRPDHGIGLVDLFENRYHRGNRYGLHDYRIFRQAHILTASGVGGGSLIYSNVNLRAQPEVLDRIGLKGIDYDRAEKFMETYRGKLSTIVTKIPLPAGVSPEQLFNAANPGKDRSYLLLDRSRALRHAAAVVSKQLGVNLPWTPLKLSVTEYIDDAQGKNEADDVHTFCERQGRCMLGCLPQARHTLNKTLFKKVFLPDPQVTLSPESEVRTIKRVGDAYEVTYIDRRGEGGEGSWPERTVRAPQVFLAAGVLGTTEILLRSRRDGLLQLSDRLGYGFSTNGDFGALAVGTRFTDDDGKLIRTADGKTGKMSVYPTRGPINTCDIGFDMEGKHYTIEDAGIPSMFAKVVRTGLNDIGALRALSDPVSFVSGNQSSSITSLVTSLRERLFGKREHDPSKDRHATEAELIDDVFFFNAMSEDHANGLFYLKGDDIDLDWPAQDPIGNQPCFAKLEDMMRKLSEAMGATYTGLPPWEGLLVFAKKTLIVTHPLGGCRIGPTMAEGTVNEFGQVYDGSKKASQPDAVHPGLYVVDGSVIPGALAANPTLTIAAQALKAIERAVGPLPL
jgi:cholesterol oxidase